MEKDKKIHKPMISLKRTAKVKTAKEAHPEEVKERPLRVSKKALAPAVPKETTAAGAGLHNLIGTQKRKKILGRGPSSGHGKTSTRGSKGQTSRAGRHFYLGFEGGQTPLIRRVPKRGFTSKFKKVYQIVNLDDLARIKDTTITPEVLEAKGLIKNKDRLVKILGDGEVTQALSVKAHAFSKKAQEKLKKAGSQVEVLNA